ncbi:hypothetical protein GMMP15_560105 [Candidatus Magnetomoraceae bacterium gMMP-15]
MLCVGILMNKEKYINVKEKNLKRYAPYRPFTFRQLSWCSCQLENHAG